MVMIICDDACRAWGHGYYPESISIYYHCWQRNEQCRCVCPFFPGKPETTRITSASWLSPPVPPLPPLPPLSRDKGSQEAPRVTVSLLLDCLPHHLSSHVLSTSFTRKKRKPKTRAEVSSEEEWSLLDAGAPSGPPKGSGGLGTDSAQQMHRDPSHQRQLSCWCLDPGSCFQVAATSG